MMAETEVLYLGLPPLKMEGDIVRFDGPPLTEEEKAAYRKAEKRRNHRNYMARLRYAERKRTTLT
jgi:hypothetical protein